MVGRAVERRRRAAIVRYWRAVELFSPPTVDSVDTEKNVFPVQAGRPLPWEPRHALERKQLEPGKVWQHTVYAGVFEIARMREVLCEVFGRDDQDEDYDGRHAGHSALLSFTVNHEGRLLMHTPVLSSCAWAVGRAHAPGPDDTTWLDGFDKDEEQCLGRLLQLADGKLTVVNGALSTSAARHAALGAIAGVAANVVLGAATGGIGVLASAASSALGPVFGPMAAGAIQKSGEAAATTVVDKAKEAVTAGPDSAPRASADSPAPAEEPGTDDGDEDIADQEPPELGSRPLDVRALAAVVRWVAERLGVAGSLLPDAIRVKSFQVRAGRARDGEQSDFLNSFIAADLARVADSLAQGTSGRALEEYLRPGAFSERASRIDVRQHPEVLLDGVQPKSTPLGRWPAAARHPLALSQQFAVNTALAALGDDDARGVYAVNGPPGTGKTTMLRDLISALVVRRAERLAALPRARDAFGEPVRWTVDGQTFTVHPPVAALTGFEMLLASANNGAVENVTTEIPARDAVDEEWREHADYLARPATFLLESDAWGAVAARLGNRANRSAFKERFWWGQDERKPTRAPGQGGPGPGGPARGGPGPDGLGQGGPGQGNARRRTGNQRSGDGLHDLLVEAGKRSERTSPPGSAENTSGPGAPRPAPLGTDTWPQAVRRFTRARQRAERLATQRQRIAETRQRIRAGDLPVRRAEANAADAREELCLVLRELSALDGERREAEISAARSESALRDAGTAVARRQQEADLASSLCSAAANELRAFDLRNSPGRLRLLLSGNRAGERWTREREPLAAALRHKESTLAGVDQALRQSQSEVAVLRTRRDSAQTRLDAVTRRCTAQQQRGHTAREGVELADRAVAQARAARAADQRTLSEAERTYGSAVPGPEWDAAPDDQDAAAQREKSAPWMDEDFARSRSELFLAALNLHRALLAAEPNLVRASMRGTMDVISGNAPKDLAPDRVRAAWQLLFLVVPVVSTTFASLDRMFAGLGPESLGWLFVDEAGQAAPQQVAGALWRTRRAIVVGDPLQLEPVVCLPWSAQQRLRAHFGVDEEWTPTRHSVQRLSDRLVPYGTTLPGPDGDPVWVGSPLRVHRRCDHLMFDVSNAIAYDNMMVFGTGERPDYPAVTRSVWLDVTSVDAQGKWIPEEGRILSKTLDTIEGRLLAELREELDAAPQDQVPAWAVTDPADRRRGDPMRAELRRRLAQRVFVISPFRDVVTGIENVTKGRLPTRGKSRRVGTVHTTQGKEADIVILVLGTRAGQRNSRDWAAQSPNLLNVAVSRARRRLIVIGNHAAWSRHRYFAELAHHPGLHITDASRWGEG
ncbi:DEAD/DEAH box helicase [Streptantibioticus silvisoli]|uniref:AAA domain-containing protein n=1 Tax=Streptantibioticus silvisoli TaxID=2705255 RepID=A0ABT6W8B7_9ACTN|nr:ATP-binding protein [Streptantibioticus silvisoli]MDI5966995.1 AAA domain-containing protein [Streptantibioticus silvisoli]